MKVCAEIKAEINKNMKQDDLIQLSIDSQGVDGVGIAKHGEYTVFVPYALAGDQIVAKVNFVNKRKPIAFADLKKVEVPSKDRVVAPCPVFGKCGGCNLQNATYESQLKFKAEKVQRNLAKLGGLTVDCPKIVASPMQFGYRNKIACPLQAERATFFWVCTNKVRTTLLPCPTTTACYVKSGQKRWQTFAKTFLTPTQLSHTILKRNMDL